MSLPRRFWASRRLNEKGGDDEARSVAFLHLEGASWQQAETVVEEEGWDDLSAPSGVPQG